MRFLTLAGALWLVLLVQQSTTAAAEPESAAAAEPGTELTVSGPPGALLRVDDRPIGRLPLEKAFFVAAGPHRFQLELQGPSYVSDILAIPQGRVAELSLSLGSPGTAIAVLSLAPMVLLAPSFGDLDARQQQAVRAAVQEGMRAEHAVLVPQQTVAAAARQQAADCLTQPRCQLDLAAAAEARLLLRLARSAAGPPPADPGGPCLRGELVDVKTGQSALRDEQACGSGDEQLLEAAKQLTRRLISGAARFTRGTVMVTSQPDAAQVFIDGQARGLTPWEGPALPGPREVRVEKRDYQPQRDQVIVVAEQAVSVQLTLTPRPSEPASASQLPPEPLPVPVERLRRPRWRLITGGIVLGVGAVIAGLGFAGVAQPAACVDPSPTAVGNCNNVATTASLGAGGVALGLAVAGVGGALIAAPARAHKN